jgi:hypothetical protein
MLQTKVVEKIKTHILCSVTFFFENHAVYEKMWKNIVERDRPQMTIWRMRIACWMPNATNTLSEYVTIIAFPQQQWLHERASVLRYTCIACLAFFYFEFNGEVLKPVLGVFYRSICTKIIRALLVIRT